MVALMCLVRGQTRVQKLEIDRGQFLFQKECYAGRGYQRINKGLGDAIQVVVLVPGSSSSLQIDHKGITF